jgi:hypothetical protein
MKKNVLKPLSVEDIEFKPSKEYLLVEMWLDNSRHLKTFKIIEGLKEGDEHHLLVCRKGSSFEDSVASKKIGLIPEKQVNKWRVFENTAKNREILKKLVAEKTALGYLLAIGLSEREAIETMRKNTSDLEKKRETER